MSFLLGFFTYNPLRLGFITDIVMSIETLIADLKMPIHPSPARDIIVECVRRWMSGLPLDQHECAIVDEALADNKAAQLLKIYEGGNA